MLEQNHQNTLAKELILAQNGGFHPIVLLKEELTHSFF